MLSLYKNCLVLEINSSNIVFKMGVHKVLLWTTQHGGCRKCDSGFKHFHILLTESRPVTKASCQWWVFLVMLPILLHIIGFGQSQNTASAPSHPIQHPTAGERTPMTPMGLVMAGCWQINSILANIDRRNSIRILNQYPFFWNILIWAQFIFFLKLFAFYSN